MWRGFDVALGAAINFAATVSGTPRYAEQSRHDLSRQEEIGMTGCAYPTRRQRAEVTKGCGGDAAGLA